MALLLEMLAKRGKQLSELVGQIPAYAIVKDKVDANPELIEQIKPILSEAFKDQKLDTQDGVRIDWPDRWVHVRPSNTEPIIRLIAEASCEEDANSMLNEVRAALGLA